MERVLVTGAAGYIGSVLVRQLLGKGRHVRGMDNLSFGGESLVGVFNHPRFEFVRGDIRDAGAVEEALTGIDAVVHLAAIVGDPACAKQPELARAINWDASKRLFDRCADSASVRRFVFASTCSNYGRMQGDGFVDETSPLRPVSLYAELKVQFEEYILGASTANGLLPTSLRFATVYGLSPRVRFDLTVNEFTRDASLGRELVVFGEQFWRPYAHVDDLARACVVVLESDDDVVRGDVFGVGDSEQNYQKKMLVEELLRLLPDTRVKYVKKDEDPRDYRVDFSKIRSRLGFTISRRVPGGMREIHDAIRTGIVADPDSPRYRNS